MAVTDSRGAILRVLSAHLGGAVTNRTQFLADHVEVSHRLLSRILMSAVFDVSLPQLNASHSSSPSLVGSCFLHLNTRPFPVGALAALVIPLVKLAV